MSNWRLWGTHCLTSEFLPQLGSSDFWIAGTLSPTKLCQNLLSPTVLILFFLELYKNLCIFLYLFTYVLITSLCTKNHLPAPEGYHIFTFPFFLHVAKHTYIF